ncbi:MAG: hypothetical protein H6740_12645 [Alphaproteobacteria bacterium]|nr:hypothetical protein [Alphaproteobacteria bacterium]
MPAWRHHAVALTACLAVAVAATWPMAAQLSTAGPGEKFLDTYFIGRYLMQAPLLEWLSPRLEQLNYPDSGSAVLVALPQFLLARGLDWLMSVNAAMNLSFLLHIAAGAYGGYRLAWRLWGPEAPESVAEFAPLLGAGLAYGLSAHALAVLAMGQPENYGLIYVALTAEGGWVLVRQRRWWGLPLMLLAASAAFLSSPYLMMALLLAAWPAGLWALLRERRAQTWVGAGALLLVCAAWAQHFSPASEGTEGRLLCPMEVSEELEPERAWAIGEDPLSALLTYPPVDHAPLVVDPIRSLRPGRVQAESPQYYGGYLGLALLILSALGLRALPVAGRRLLIACAVTPLVLSMGTHLQLNGWVPTLHGARLMLPLSALQGAPGLGAVFRLVQVPERLVLGAVLALSLAIVPALRALRGPPARVLLLAATPVLEQLVLGPAAPPLPLYSFHPPEAYVALAGLPDELAVVDMPPVGWSAHRAVFPDADGGPAPPPMSWLRHLVRGAATHGRPVPYGGCVVGDTAGPGLRPGPRARGRRPRGDAGRGARARRPHAPGGRIWLVGHPPGHGDPEPRGRGAGAPPRAQ